MKTFYSHLDYYERGTVTCLFSEIYGLTEVDDPDDADIIVWNGGEDIGTSIYLEEPVSRGIPFGKSSRDLDEIALFNQYKNNNGKLLLGICRGAQLLNCLNGGKLYQDVDGHGQSHPMIDLRTNEVIQVTSTHHQQMIPAPNSGEIVGVSSVSRYKNHEEGVAHHTPTRDLKNGVDVEIVWYPKNRTLCIQGHPEYVPNSRFAAYTLELLTECFQQVVKAKAA